MFLFDYRIVGASQKDASTAGEKAERDSNTDSDLDLNIDLEVSDDEMPEGGDKDKRESVCRNTTDVKS